MKSREFGQLIKNISEILEWVGVVGVLSMMIITVVDVIGAKVFLSPLRGGMEMVGFGQVIAISCTITVGLFFGRHIDIELFVSWMSKQVQKHIHLFVSLLGFVFFVLLAWQSCAYSISLKKAGEISSSAYIPFYPFAFIIALGAVVASLYYINEILNYFAERSAKNGSS
ncbi:MAG: TRAP transporter small permease [Firmicutes bacterium]|nr:TRAP transporter small permease [Bacillota bacterium]